MEIAVSTKKAPVFRKGYNYGKLMRGVTFHLLLIIGISIVVKFAWEGLLVNLLPLCSKPAWDAQLSPAEWSYSLK